VCKTFEEGPEWDGKKGKKKAVAAIIKILENKNKMARALNRTNVRVDTPTLTQLTHTHKTHTHTNKQLGC
jgi:hypothetical protein